MPKLKMIFKFILTLAISGVCLYFAARNIEFARIAHDIANMQWRYAALALAISMGALALRALRWHRVLSRTRDFPVSTTFWATAIGYLANNILPARAGELVRSVVVALGADLRKTLVLATALTERIIDAGMLLIIAFAMLLFTRALPASIQGSWYILLPLVLGILALVMLAPLMQRFWLRLVRLLPFGKKLHAKIELLLVGLFDGIRVFYNSRLLAVFLLLTVVVWFVDAAGMFFICRAFGAEISLAEAAVFIAALGFASSVPSTPGYVGVYQAVAVLLLPVFGVGKDKAFLIVSFFQAGFLTVTALLGVPGWLIMQRRIGAARLEKELEDS